MYDTDELKRVSGKLRALLDKTMENGATEAEALAAAAKAHELMQKYQLSLTDLELKRDDAVVETFDRPDKLRFVAADMCCHGIEKLCGVKIWFHKRVERNLFNGSQEVRLLAILGLRGDIEFAHWLYAMIDDSVDCETEHFHKTLAYKHARKKTLATSSFRLGMAQRINQRLLDMAWAAQNNKTATGTSLVVVKDGLLDEAIARLGLKFQQNKVKRKINFAAHEMGRGRAGSASISIGR